MGIVYLFMASQLGIEPGPLAVRMRHPNRWTAEELPGNNFILFEVL